MRNWGHGGKAAAEMEEVDEETLSGYQSDVEVPLKWQLHPVCPILPCSSCP